MNFVVLNLIEKVKDIHEFEGSIWEMCGELCIFAQVDDKKFCLIGLQSGNRMMSPDTEMEDIVDGAKFIAMSADIEITAIHPLDPKFN